MKKLVMIGVVCMVSACNNNAHITNNQIDAVRKECSNHDGLNYISTVDWVLDESKATFEFVCNDGDIIIKNNIPK